MVQQNMATIDTDKTVQHKQDDPQRELQNLYQRFFAEPDGDGVQEEAKRLLSPRCDRPHGCAWFNDGGRGEYIEMKCGGYEPDRGPCGRHERIWKNGEGPSGGWAAGIANAAETTAARVLAAIEGNDMAVESAIVERSRLSVGAVRGCLHRLMQSKSGPPWIEAAHGYDHLRKRTGYRLTERGELRLQMDRELGLAPEVDDDDDEHEETED